MKAAESGKAADRRAPRRGTGRGGLMPETAGSTPYHLAVIIADLQEMIRIADDAPEKLGTLAWLLECALIEAKRLAELHREANRPDDGTELWRPTP
jgi:hypothetical protein